MAEYLAAMEKKKLREGIRLVMAISADGNKFIQVLVGQEGEGCRWSLLARFPACARAERLASVGARPCSSFVKQAMASHPRWAHLLCACTGQQAVGADEVGPGALCQHSGWR